MYRSDISFNFVSEQAVIIFLPGYSGNKNELPFLEKFFTKNKKISFFSLSYHLQDTNGKKYPIKDVVLEIEKTIKNFLDNYNFKECYLIGYSMGAALALEIISKKEIKFDKLILLSVFDDRKDLLKERGAEIKPLENISPIKTIKKNKKIPVFFIHGEFDISINPERSLMVYNNSNKLNSKFILLPISHYFNSTAAKRILLNSLKNIL